MTKCSSTSQRCSRPSLGGTRRPQQKSKRGRIGEPGVPATRDNAPSQGTPRGRGVQRTDGAEEALSTNAGAPSKTTGRPTAGMVNASRSATASSIYDLQAAWPCQRPSRCTSSCDRKALTTWAAPRRLKPCPVKRRRGKPNVRTELRQKRTNLPVRASNNKADEALIRARARNNNTVVSSRTMTVSAPRRDLVVVCEIRQ